RDTCRVNVAGITWVHYLFAPSVRPPGNGDERAPTVDGVSWLKLWQGNCSVSTTRSLQKRHPWRGDGVESEGGRALATLSLDCPEETMAARVFLTFTASLTLVAAAIAPAAAQPADTDWPMYQYDLKHTGKTKVAGPGAGAQGVQTKWIYKSVSWIKDQVA